MKEKLKEGTKVIYSNSENPTLMEEVEVVSVDKKEGVATLSNKVKVTRLPNLEKVYKRVGNKLQGFALPMNPENEERFKRFKAYFSIKRSIEKLSSYGEEIKGWEISKLEKVQGKLSKVINLIEEK